MSELTLNSQLLTPARFCWVLDIGPSTEAEWRARKRVAFFQQGRLIRYTPEAVLEFIARNTVRARGQRTEDRGQRAEAGFCLPASDWSRIERLIADQVRAAVASQRIMKEAA